MSTLYLVATPIGNLEDISARALRVLRQVHRIVAEDTRRTQRLLAHYQIQQKCLSFHAHNFRQRLPRILTELENGDVALVSDAGTPLLNDPGYELVNAALQAGHRVSPIPGPSAPLAALIVSGLPTDAFLYLGYLPRKQSKRRQLLEEIAHLPYTLIFLETPHRLLSALADLEDELGNRQIAIARELTKLHEEIFRGTVSQARQHFQAQAPRGEFTLVIAGAERQAAGKHWRQSQLEREIEKRLAQGSSPTDLARDLAHLSGWPRRTVYQLILSLKDQPDTAD